MGDGWGGRGTVELRLDGGGRERGSVVGLAEDHHHNVIANVPLTLDLKPETYPLKKMINKVERVGDGYLLRVGGGVGQISERVEHDLTFLRLTEPRVDGVGARRVDCSISERASKDQSRLGWAQPVKIETGVFGLPRTLGVETAAVAGESLQLHLAAEEFQEVFKCWAGVFCNVMRR